MPQTAAATKSAMENTKINPKEKLQRKVVHVALVFDGVEFNPSDLYAALDTKYGTVNSLKDTSDRGTYQFRISP